MSITRGGTLPCAPLRQSSDSCTVGGTHWTNEWSCWAFSGSYTFAHCCCYCSDTRSCPTLATLWAVAPQAPLSTGFSRQEYWSGLPFPSLGIFLTQGSNLCLLHWKVDSLLLRSLGSLPLHTLFLITYDTLFPFPWLVGPSLSLRPCRPLPICSRLQYSCLPMILGHLEHAHFFCGAADSWGLSTIGRQKVAWTRHLTLRA